MIEMVGNFGTSLVNTYMCIYSNVKTNLN